MPGSLKHSPADVVRKLLVDLNLGVEPGAGAWPVYSLGEPDRPDNVVTVFDTAGRNRGRDMLVGERAEFHGIQIRVRSTTADVGYTKARSIAVALDHQYDDSVTVAGTTSTGAGTYCVQSITRTTDVIALGKEVPATKRSLFTVNALVTLRQVA